MRLINERGFNTEEVIIFTEKMHTQKIPFLNGIFSEKISPASSRSWPLWEGDEFCLFLMTDQTSKYHILSQSEGELKIFCQKKVNCIVGEVTTEMRLVNGGGYYLYVGLI